MWPTILPLRNAQRWPFTAMFNLMADYYTNGLTTVAQQSERWSASDDTETILEIMEGFRDE